MKKEVFKKIKGFEQYEISSFGNLRNAKNRKIRKLRISGDYYDISLNYKSDNKTKWKSLLIHRLVGEAFVENIENKPCINHKDGNKLNRNFSELRRA